MILLGFVIDPGEDIREAVYRISCDHGLEKLIVANYDTLVAMGMPDEEAGFAALQDYDLLKTYDTTQLLLGQGIIHKPEET